MKIKLPDTIFLLLFILAFFCVLTWLVPAGEFDRVTVNGRQLVQPGTYHEVAANPASLGSFILAPIKGFTAAADVIVFIFFVAGSFGVLNATGAISTGLKAL